MLRDRRRVKRTTRRTAALAAATLVLAATVGCGIKGPLKRVDAAGDPPPPASAPPADPAKPRLP